MSVEQPTKKEDSGGDGADVEDDVKYPRETDANEDDDAKEVENDEEIENEVDEDEEDEEDEDEDEEEDVVCSPWDLVMHSC
jgi:transcription elongation factor SPT5